jgi:hypothetical protein
MIRVFQSIITITIIILQFGCNDVENTSQKSESEAKPLFTLLTPDMSGVHFTNSISEKEGENYLLNDNMYQGSGVAVCDVNNDGLIDIFYCGNQVGDKLYINQGDLKFKDITQSSGIGNDGTWSMGATFADVNADGLMDLYVSKHYFREPEKRANKLYINQGNLTFEEQAAEYGLADQGYSIQANFFDMDDDGDLDVFVANQPPTWRAEKGNKQNLGRTIYSDHIYENIDGIFVQITNEAGVGSFMYSLNASACDFDQDGDVDIYVPVDYDGPDAHYQNDGTGTFTNVVGNSMGHLSTFSMGSDVADINNDGLIDLFTADMVAEDNYRNKTNMGGMNPEKFWALVNNGQGHQYMFNAMQLNNGDGTFSEVGQITGAAMTDWSWSPLLADLDNDGYKDLTVTNGLFRDVRNKDYHSERNKLVEQKDGKNMLRSDSKMMPLIEMAPSVRIPNYAYKNLGKLQFQKVTNEWGFNFAGWSQGSAYADLDNDGDLDLVVNNMNDVSHVYRNNSNESSKNNHLRIITQDSKNHSARNARVEVYYADGGYQIGENSPVRGYMSQSEEVIHFGLGKVKKADSLIITWPNETITVLKDVAANQLLTVNLESGKSPLSRTKTKTFFSLDKKPLVSHQHLENGFDDYANEVLLPHRMSYLGPHMSKADVNGDGFDDMFIAGPVGAAGRLLLSNGNGYDEQRGPWGNHVFQEDIASCFFDIDGDGDLDLYVATGGNERPTGTEFQQDRLYINNNGTFTEGELPELRTSNGCVAAFDFDADGDEDLFVGGRQEPGKYPYPTSSHILVNNGGKLTIATPDIAPELMNIGMVADAVWSDFDKDGDHDLIMVGEWMPLTVFENTDGKLSNITEKLGLLNTTGWWNTIECADMDGDGDDDFIAGNLGTNIKYKASKEEPFKVYSYDFDSNGTNDIVLSYYQEGKCFPVRGRQCSSQQMPFIKKKFPTYHAFANATVEQVYSEHIDEALSLQVEDFNSVYIENKNGSFKLSHLPIEAQFSTIQGIVTHDVNKDGHLDIIAAGNYYQREVETTRSDASIGYVFLGNGKGHFETVKPTEAGLSMNKDIRDIQLINSPKGLKLVGIPNGDYMEFYSLN